MAAAEVEAALPFVTYFPSYEMVIDDLRDYRFYEEDMLHPSGTAVEYIFQKLGEHVLDPSTAAPMASWERVQRAVRHRVSSSDSKGVRAFASKQLMVLDKLAEDYPYADSTAERAHFDALMKDV